MGLVVLLNNIRSSHNVGSIFRTSSCLPTGSDAAGVEKIYLCGITPGPKDKYGRINKKLAKVALGAEKNVPYEHHKSASVLIGRLKNPPAGGGYKILALEQNKNSVDIFKFRPVKKFKYALVLGEETKGLPAGILKKADKILEIPQGGKKESLNVSVAFGIAAYHLLY